MTVTLAKKNPVAGVRTFTVTSETEADKKYIVVEVKRDGTHYFCQCSDFFYRKLPFIGTNLYANCKHITAILEAVNGDR
jgi:predicted nucleic acid-binding Zn finger protein